MEYPIDEELRLICKEIATENKSVEQWAENESSDWFQTKRYNGGFDAGDMHFAFTVYANDGQYCFAITLADALAIARNEINIVDISSSPWS